MVTLKKASIKFFSLLLICAAQPALAETLSIGVTHSEYLPSVPVLQSRVTMPRHYQNAPSGGASQQQETKPLVSETMVMTPQQAPLQGLAQTQIQAPPSAPRTPPTLEKPIIEWFPIPTGMAGVWTKRGDLTTSVTDLRTGISEPLNQWTEDEMTVTWGHQTDKLGNVWHANLLPAERDGLTNGKQVKFLTVGQKLEKTGANTLLTRTHYVVSESYGRGGTVADVFQQEALNHYVVIAESELQNNSTNRVFAYQGTPLRDGALLTRFTRVGAFTPTPDLAGMDLVQSLNDYLRSIGRTDLMR